MPTRSSKLDLNQLAKAIVDEATGEPVAPRRRDQTKAAAGSKGGISRMAKLTPDERMELSQNLNQARQAKEALASKEASAKANQLKSVN
jgi:uncharacterized protein involved in type VI secretion and phage assembly